MADLFDQPDDATPLTSEEKEGLKQTWITTRADLNEAEQANIDDAIAWTTKLQKPDFLSESFIFKLHKRMFGDVWTWAGAIRTTNKNIGVDKIEINSRLGHLLNDVRYWIKNETFNPDEILARLHHGLVAIHPFPNGNGRHSRLVTDLVAGQLGIEPFTWGGNGLQKIGELRDEYVRTLRSADDYDFEPLKTFVRT